MIDICKERWFQVIERLWRPLTSWGLGACTVAYGVRAVAGLAFDELTFAALASAAGFAFYRRGEEKMKAREIEG